MVLVSYIRITVHIIVNNAAIAGSIETIVPTTVKSEAASRAYLKVSCPDGIFNNPISEATELYE